jgi:hypothetical protein
VVHAPRALAAVLAFALALGACARPEQESTGPSSPARALEELFGALWQGRQSVAARHLSDESFELIFGEGSGAPPIAVWLPSEGDIQSTDVEAGADADHVTLVLTLQSGVVVRVPAARDAEAWRFDLTP